MAIDIARDRITMSQRERDLLKIMASVSKASVRRPRRHGWPTCRCVRCAGCGQAEAGRRRRLVHGLRGKPSNRRVAAELRQQFWRCTASGSPTSAQRSPARSSPNGVARQRRHAATLAARRGAVAAATAPRPASQSAAAPRLLRRVGADGCVDPRLAGGTRRDVVLISMIDDATSRVLARFYPHGTVEAHFDSAHSPQAKGRVERSFGTAQDRGSRNCGWPSANGGASQCGAGAVVAGAQSAVRQGGAGRQRCASGVGRAVQPGGDFLDSGGAGGGQRLHDSVCESVLPVAQADLSRGAGRAGDGGRAAGREYGDPIWQALPEVRGGGAEGAGWGLHPQTPGV